MIDRLTLRQKLGVYLATFVFLLFILMPFIEMIRVSLRPMSHLMTADFTWWSEDFSLQAYRDMWNTIGRGLPWTALVKNRRKDGDHYWVQANVTPILENGKIHYHIKN